MPSPAQVFDVGLGLTLVGVPSPLDEAGAFQEALEALDGPWDEREPAFTADGLALFFASDRARAEEGGSWDLWRSVREPSGWLAPEPLSPKSFGVRTIPSPR